MQVKITLLGKNTHHNHGLKDWVSRPQLSNLSSIFGLYEYHVYYPSQTHQENPINISFLPTTKLSSRTHVLQLLLSLLLTLLRDTRITDSTIRRHHPYPPHQLFFHPSLLSQEKEKETKQKRLQQQQQQPHRERKKERKNKWGKGNTIHSRFQSTNYTTGILLTLRHTRITHALKSLLGRGLGFFRRICIHPLMGVQ